MIRSSLTCFPEKLLTLGVLSPDECFDRPNVGRLKWSMVGLVGLGAKTPPVAMESLLLGSCLVLILEGVVDLPNSNPKSLPGILVLIVASHVSN